MGSGLEQGDLVTVFGGAGFVGRYVVRALAREGIRVRAASRRPDLAGHLQPMGGVGQIQPVQANLRYPDSVAKALEGASVVINAVGLLAPVGRQSFNAIHVEGPRVIGAAAQAAGVRRVIHISALGANPKGKAKYARTKADGEAALLNAFDRAIILRPSIVFGPEDEFFNRFAAMAQISPVLPLIGGGRTRFQPVFVGDLATAVLAAAQGAARPGTIYELGGPQIFTFRQLLDLVQEWTGRKRRYIRLPFWLAKLMALVTWPLPNGLRPLTVDQVRLLKTDNVVSEAAEAEARTLKGLGLDAPHAIGMVVPGYLERFHRRGQFSHYRA